MTALNAIDVPFVHRLGWTLVHSVWQVALVSCALACLLALMRGRSANTRYLIAYPALVLAAALRTRPPPQMSQQPHRQPVPRTYPLRERQPSPYGFRSTGLARGSIRCCRACRCCGLPE